MLRRLIVLFFSCRHDVVMLQEVHGNEQGIGELASRIPRHSILGSFCRDSSSGGVLIIISEGGGGSPLAGVRR